MSFVGSVRMVFGIANTLCHLCLNSGFLVASKIAIFHRNSGAKGVCCSFGSLLFGSLFGSLPHLCLSTQIFRNSLPVFCPLGSVLIRGKLRSSRAAFRVVLLNVPYTNYIAVHYTRKCLFLGYFCAFCTLCARCGCSCQMVAARTW
jgi:hypothetical protein